MVELLGAYSGPQPDEAPITCTKTENNRNTPPFRGLETHIEAEVKAIVELTATCTTWIFRFERSSSAMAGVV